MSYENGDLLQPKKWAYGVRPKVTYGKRTRIMLENGVTISGHVLYQDNESFVVETSVLNSQYEPYTEFPSRGEVWSIGPFDPTKINWTIVSVQDGYIVGQFQSAITRVVDYKVWPKDSFRSIEGLPYQRVS